jgi:mRNA turnover protein 4
MESQLRQLGLQIKLDSGNYYVLSDYVVCEEGRALSPEQSKIINHLSIHMDEFRINILGYLKKNGEFEKVIDEMEV